MCPCAPAQHINAQQASALTDDQVAPWQLRATLAAAIGDCVVRDGNAFQENPDLGTLLDYSMNVRTHTHTYRTHPGLSIWPGHMERHQTHEHRKVCALAYGA